jgi:hypothetical protein
MQLSLLKRFQKLVPSSFLGWQKESMGLPIKPP